jgi:hypothetical protein
MIDQTLGLLLSILICSIIFIITFFIKNLTSKESLNPAICYLNRKTPSGNQSIFKIPYNINNFNKFYNKNKYILIFNIIIALYVLIARPTVNEENFTLIEVVIAVLFIIFIYSSNGFEIERDAEYKGFQILLYYLYYYYQIFIFFSILLIFFGYLIIGFALGTVVCALWYYIHQQNIDFQLEPIKSYIGTINLTNPNIPEKEKQIEISRNLELIEDSLILVGIEHHVFDGRIDILARDRNNYYVVMELKKDSTKSNVVQQIERYMAHIEHQHHGMVRGYIIANSFDLYTQQYCKNNNKIQCLSYRHIMISKLEKEGTKIVANNVIEALGLVRNDVLKNNIFSLKQFDFSVSIENNVVRVQYDIDIPQDVLINAHLHFKNSFSSWSNYMIMNIINEPNKHLT